MRFAFVSLAVVVVLAAAGLAYYRVGWSRMADECGLGDSPLAQRNLDQAPFDENGSRSVRFSWQWSGGFTCTYSDGTQRSSYWL